MTAERLARCRCGRLTATCRGEPVRVSVCHCLGCRKRTGGTFSAQARFALDRVTITGNYREWEMTGESGRWARYRWCPVCGSTLGYTIEAMPGVIAIMLGAFEGEMPVPAFSVYENRMPDWLRVVGDGIVHD